MSISEISNPGGILSNRNQGAEKLIRYQALGYTARSNLTAGFEALNTTKWYDGNFSLSGQSLLRLTLSRAAAVGGYRLQTADCRLKAEGLFKNSRLKITGPYTDIYVYKES